ncbi:uncharacterized protein L201_006928 [Kwoniella dendrophila CBS 6074]|uniref:RNase III domain-containing protein n=1 Tax=Kwoniella dendrophila CBS 6074 TaxID=1295534 RepID=A0AAX4K2Y2_9TREE
MSTTAVRMTTHAPSPSYVPRSTLPLRPNSPALPPKPQTNGFNNNYSNGSSSSSSSRHNGHSRSSSTSRLVTIGSSASKSSNLNNVHAPIPTPRLGPMERSSSGLRNEITSTSNNKKQFRSEAAQAILNMLSSLPAPLPETLPPTFLPTPSASPTSSITSSIKSPPKSFGEYARSSLKRNKRKRATDSSDSSSSLSSDEPSSSSGKNAEIGLGLGLGLSMSPEQQIKKKVRTDKPDLFRQSSSTINDRSLTPSIGNLPGSSPALPSKKLGNSALRNEVVENKENWSKDKWRTMAQVYRDRALLLKRHGDAYQRTHSAHPKYKQQLPFDHLKGLLCLTDAVLLWLYAYFCDEQAGGRVRMSPYLESEPLRGFVRKGWEIEMRKPSENFDGGKEMAQAMVGLMHLIEAVIGYLLTSEQLAHLNKRGRELASSATIPTNNHGPSPGSTTSASPPASANIQQTFSSSSQSQQHAHPSPAGRSSSSGTSESHHSPDSHISHISSSSSSLTTMIPPDLLPLISTSTSSSSKAQQSLLTSRHHLSLKNLRFFFPQTFEKALNSKLNDEFLPIPGDNLGSAKKINIDSDNLIFAWPIELGMCAPIAHTVAFGRSLIEEFAEHAGKDWIKVLEPSKKSEQ